MEEKKIRISEKNLYCIARLLQSCIHGYNQFTGCADCKYYCQTKEDYAPNYEKNIFRLQEITGVDFGVQADEIPIRFKNDKSRCGDSDF